jgi:hypothetical protein
MNWGSFLGGAAQGVAGGLQDVQQVQQIKQNQNRLNSQKEISDYTQQAMQNGTDPMEMSQNLYMLYAKGGDPQAAAHWYDIYDKQKQVKIGRALNDMYVAADAGDAYGATSAFNTHSKLAGHGFKAEVVPQVGPDGTESHGVALTSEDGRRTVLAPDSWQHVAKAQAALQSMGMEKYMLVPQQGKLYGAEAHAQEAGATRTEAMTTPEVQKTEAETATEQEKPALVRGQTALAGAEAGQARAQTGLIGAKTDETRALLPIEVGKGRADIGETQARTGFIGEQAKTDSALRNPRVLGMGMDIADRAAQISKTEEDVQRNRVADPSILAGREAETEERRAQTRYEEERAAYLARDGKPRAPTKPQPWSKQDQDSLDDAMQQVTGYGNDTATGKPVKTDDSPHPVYDDPKGGAKARMAVRTLTQSLMTHRANADLRFDHVGAAAIADAALSGQADIVMQPGSPDAIIEYNGTQYRVPAGVLASTKRGR